MVVIRHIASGPGLRRKQGKRQRKQSKDKGRIKTIHGYLAQRKKKWRQPKPRYTRGLLAKYVKLVSSASKGAVTG